MPNNSGEQPAGEVGDVKLAGRDERLRADAGEDRVAPGLFDHAALGCAPHVTHVARAQHALAEILVPAESRVVLLVAERVGARAQPDQRLARLEESLQVGELLVAEGEEPHEEDRGVGRGQGLEAGQARAVFVLFRVAGRKHQRGAEAQPLHFAGQRGHGRLRAVMVRAYDEHQVGLGRRKGAGADIGKSGARPPLRRHAGGNSDVSWWISHV